MVSFFNTLATFMNRFMGFREPHSVGGGLFRGYFFERLPHFRCQVPEDFVDFLGDFSLPAYSFLHRNCLSLEIHAGRQTRAPTKFLE